MIGGGGGRHYVLVSVSCFILCYIDYLFIFMRLFMIYVFYFMLCEIKNLFCFYFYFPHMRLCVC